MLRAEKGQRVQQDGARQRGKGPSLRTACLRRCLVLLLALTFSTSGLVHIPMGDHVAFAASVSHEIASASQGASGEPCCPEHTGQPHSTTCGMVNGCSFCAPLLSSPALMAPLYSEFTKMPSDEVHLGRVPSSQFRPPKLSANI